MADEATSTTAAPDAPSGAAADAPSGATPSAPSGNAPTAEQIRSEEILAEPSPGFGERGRMRRRLRFLRKARELAYRDLGGLVFEMQRLGERHDELVAAKLATLTAIDTELRALEHALADRRSVTVLRESGIAACPRCAAIHGSEDRFCPACGLAMERDADLPIAGAVAAPPTAAPALAASPTPAPPASPRPTGAQTEPAGQPQTQPPVAAPRRPEPPPAPPAPPTPTADDRPTEIIRPPEQQS